MELCTADVGIPGAIFVAGEAAGWPGMLQRCRLTLPGSCYLVQLDRLDVLQLKSLQLGTLRGRVPCGTRAVLRQWQEPA